MTDVNERFIIPDAQINAEYFNWLVQHVAMDSPEYFNYNKLMDFLYYQEFEWQLNRDSNRAQDGIDLRDLFSYETGIIDWYSALGGPCNVLEMLVALAHRIDNEVMYDYELGDRTALWFWEMVENLGLDYYDDNHFRPDRVEKILHIWLCRKYNSDGSGGIFPINESQNDQREVEIWLQAQEYFLEKYGF